MRELIARTLCWVLSVWAPSQTGRHSARYLHLSDQLQPEYPSPWSRPWLSPSKAEARRLFQEQAARLPHPTVELERRNAAALASAGIDYPYTYAGAPFGAFDFDPMAEANA